MLENLSIEEILFIDIETVPLVPDFNKLTEKWKELWEHKMQYNISNGEPVEELYNRAGIYAEFGKVICISAGYVTQKQGENYFRVKSFCDDDEKKLISNFFHAWNKFTRVGKRRLCAHNGQEFDFPYISRRALVHNLKLPKILDIAGSKPWEIKDQLWTHFSYGNLATINITPHYHCSANCLIYQPQRMILTAVRLLGFIGKATTLTVL